MTSLTEFYLFPWWLFDTISLKGPLMKIFCMAYHYLGELWERILSEWLHWKLFHKNDRLSVGFQYIREWIAPHEEFGNKYYESRTLIAPLCDRMYKRVFAANHFLLSSIYFINLLIRNYLSSFYDSLQMTNQYADRISHDTVIIGSFTL